MLEGKILIPSQEAERDVLGKINLESGSLLSERRKIYAQVCAWACECVWVFSGACASCSVCACACACDCEGVDYKCI